jgi:hypothetical protein
LELEDAHKIARYAADKLSAEGDVIGAFLFGSAVYGGLDEGSDIDICLLYDRSDIHRHRESKELGGAHMDICRYSVDKFVRVFEDKGTRGRGDTWFDVALWLGMMRGCQIIKDPRGILHKWREDARNWRWREDEIGPLKRIYLENLAAANLFIQEKKALEATIFLREGTTAAVCVRLMEKDWIPFWDPRFLYRSLYSSRDLEGLADVFQSINELDHVVATSLRSSLKRLASFIEQEGGRNVGVTTQLHNSQDAYWRHQYPISLLSARFATFLLAPIVLAKRHVELPPLGERLLDGGQHVDMILKLKRSIASFHAFYLNLLFSRKWNMKALHKIFDALCDLDHRGES